ncbi:flavodoxin family protein [Uliginosibacterium sp. H1]|uniref:flavodoxin family protein n=1 Tax=Uliginosibacterium sp. H1 TaxID=3114757 RepID=UPI002E18F7B5|nr:flavodoxin family protein [Uliginosibacterium sp. H1]
MPKYADIAADIEVRHGQPSSKLDRGTFRIRFHERFADPAFAVERDAIERLEDIAWQAYQDGRKAPVTRKAGPEFEAPEYDLSVDWLATRERLRVAQERWADPQTPDRLLVIAGGARNEGSCPGEVSKTWRMAGLVEESARALGIEVDILDLSRVTSEYGRAIHPCKGCVATAMPLCHWPCSCYPNHALDQADDWMAEIYERWVAAHGIVIVTPTYWYQAPGPLKAMIDRLVCADGGNPDPTSTHGKKALEAKVIEANGWHYPKHLAGRAYGVVVHGDVAGVESLRRNLTDWLDWMGLIDAGAAARLDRYVGYYEPYYNSHDTLDADEALQEEVRNVGRALAYAIKDLRSGRLLPPDTHVRPPRPK